MPEWTFLTNHSHVLLCIQGNPSATVREIANQVGITERSVQRILRELSEYGVISVCKEGRRNYYRIDGERPLRHPVESMSKVRELLALVGSDAS